MHHRDWSSSWVGSLERAFRRLPRHGLLALAAMLAGAALLQGAEPYSRAGNQEFYVTLGGQFSETANYSGASTKLEIGDTFAGGFGFGYHVSDHFGLNLEFLFGNPTITVTSPTGYLRQDAFTFNGKFNVDYNILKTAFTPFVTAGIGWNMFQTDVPNSNPVLVCYPGYYYWWCDYAKPTYTETTFSWNVGAGVRYDVQNRLFFKAVAGVTWCDLLGADDLLMIPNVMISIGATF